MLLSHIGLLLAPIFLICDWSGIGFCCNFAAVFEMQHRYLYNFLKGLGILLGFILLCTEVAAQQAPTLPPPAQGGNQIIIDSTDVFYFSSFGPDSLKIRKLLGNVILRQDTAVLYCDSAYQYLDSNFIEAFGRVRIIMNQHLPDSMRRTIAANKLTFDGETKIINFWDNVVLTDKQVVLRTPRLTYYRLQDYAEYLQSGEITSKDNVLTSQKGYYYPKSDMAYFKDKVKLVNPQFVMATDTLGYNTESKVAFFLAPTWVNDSVNSMYTEDGYYDTENDYAFLHQNASIGDTSHTLYADTIQYDQGRDLGKALGHIRMEQLDSSLTVFGNYGEFRSKTEATFVTDSAFALQRLNNDTLFLFADTLSTYKDTLEDKRFFMAYKNSYFITKDMQGVCDSLVYWYDDSLMFFYQSPALWSDQSQITGDTITVRMREGTIDSMSIPSNPLIVTQEDTVGYDQIKGKQLFAKFEAKRLKTMWIFGNSESIYFTKDDKEQYMGMNKARCSDMLIQFKENKPSKILFKEKPEGEFFPIHLVLQEENVLDGFVWRAEERPTRPSWVNPVIFRQAMLRDTLKLRLDALLLELEDLEFEYWALLEDSVFMPPVEETAPDNVPEVPEGGILIDSLAPGVLPVDSQLVDVVVVVDSIPSDTIVKTGKSTVKSPDAPNPALRKLTKEERRKMNFRQRMVAHKKRMKAKKELKTQKKVSKPKLTFRQRWVAFKKKLKHKATKDEIAAKEKAKVDQRRAKLARKAKRMNDKHQEYMKKNGLKKPAAANAEAPHLP
jgi:lipopolysaccharide export system protein LptA